MKIKALIIDDEPHAQKLLAKLITDSPSNISIVGTASTVNEAFEMINLLKPEIIFLDIQIKDKTGFDLLDKIDQANFYTIFVTSHMEYALEAIKNDAFDYLLKPIDEDELNAALLKVEKLIHSSYDYNSISSNSNRLEIRSQKGFTYIDKKNIIALKASGSYVEILTKDKSYILSKNLSFVLRSFEGVSFFRAHNSFAINLKEVVQYIFETNTIHMSNGLEIPLAHRRKDDFMQVMKKV